ncbi:MAG: phosphatidate cytidylyltransferase [Methanoregulaceae archaeon]|nr:phosphatidate cytidylyltransferase [Methanoregulaceae archaeon]
MREVARKTVHLVFGLGIAAFILVFPTREVIALLGLAVISGFILSDAISRGYRIPLVSFLVDSLERKDVLPGKGALYFAMSSLFCLLVFPLRVVAPAIVTLAILDGVATIIGRRFGRIRIFNGKSLEGSVSGAAVTLVALLPFLPPVQALAASVAGGVVELLSPVDDNLVIPVAVCLVLFFIPF